ncbi:prepilin-type N-terminal cleavage/methylation domain-containing protein [Kushneria pakistanensis]|uniref:Type II secretion system protein H n=1 Tax=Kushneria pakistanensis TaxID=1508770 RepID=A0ABQ3FKP7_9GAMM|nr:GspH/FimT family pseudopilin [Kushneria pakistanensis]GHC27164.1 prepilin-type N-terminal cleavage/methylation domain-containing protein [Kushneria pakistanensis]
MRSQRGISLLEATVCMAILALLVGRVIPFTQQWHADHLLNTQMRDVQGLMQQAQMASLDHGRPWTLCGSDDGLRCDGQWQHLLVMDADGHVRHRIKRHDTVTLRWQGLSQALVFHPRLSSSILNGTFHLCHGQRTQRLIVNRLGRTRRETADTNGDC